MKNFTYYNPTKLIFGKGQLAVLPEEVAKYGKNVLLVYGGGSIKRNGIYDNVIAKLKEMDAKVTELSGVEPNPRISTVRKGVQLCKEHDIDFVLAVGGGSTIDCTKAVAAGAKTDVDMWDIVTKKEKATGALPFGVVLTHAATGSEMNRGSVITNWELNEKHGWGSPYTHAKFTINDPAHTVSVPKDQTIYGMVDMMSHVLEHYFHTPTNTLVQDRFCESVLLTVMETAPKLLEDLESYEYRETIMLNGTLALNDMLNMGYHGDWATHNLEHAASAVHDIPHGGGLAILMPHWMEYVLDEDNAYRFKKLAIRVFGIDSADKNEMEVAKAGIKALRDFWNSIGAPSHLSEYGIDESSIEAMADATVAANSEYGGFKKLNRTDSVEIFKRSL